MQRFAVLFLTAVLLACSGCSDGAEQPTSQQTPDAGERDAAVDDVPESEEVRVASFNASLYRAERGGLIDDLSDPDHRHARRIAEIIQINRPDILLINEFDYDEDQIAVELFADNFLSAPQGDQEPLDYPYFHAFPSNTGIPSGYDLDDNGVVGDEEGTQDYANDAFGYGLFPGQYALAVFSKYPLRVDQARTFQYFLWDDMPDNLIPEDFYEDEELEIFRLSSKNHVDVPIDVGDHRLHLLASHPTPPAFDGEERRNMRRNQDEIRLWNDYIHPDRGDYLYDDDGTEGGLDEETYFVIAGDLNADPDRSDERGAVAAVLDNPRVADPEPRSDGGEQVGPHERVTSDWPPQPGNMRVDYALPSSNLEVHDSAVFWPPVGEPFANLVGATDHRLVWVDVELGAQ